MVHDDQVTSCLHRVHGQVKYLHRVYDQVTSCLHRVHDQVAIHTNVRGELGQLPLHLFWKERIIKYWHRLSSGFIPSLLQHALSEQLALDKGGKECWLSKTKDIYDKAGLSNLHVSANMDNIKDHVNTIMTRYRVQYVQEWFAQIQRPLSIRGNALNKLRTYKLFKHQFQLEK